MNRVEALFNVFEAFFAFGPAIFTLSILISLKKPKALLKFPKFCAVCYFSIFEALIHGESMK